MLSRFIKTSVSEVLRARCFCCHKSVGNISCMGNRFIRISASEVEG